MKTIRPIHIVALSFLLCLMFLGATLQAKTKVGSRDFKLGITKATVEGLIKSKYNGKREYDATYNRYIIKPRYNHKAFLYFDHKDRLYKLIVEMGADINGAKKVKKILGRRYETKNIIKKEKKNRKERSYLVGRWLVENKRYRVSLLESEYCRGTSKMIPCSLKIKYLDTKMLKEKKAYEKKKGDEAREKADTEKYDF
ncbi:MAG: hypothetical protein GY754_26545 [bacterium]|nr:hypothetical protein [bacterium]